MNQLPLPGPENQGVTSFVTSCLFIRLDYGNNNIFLDRSNGVQKSILSLTLLNANNLVAEGAQDATRGFDFQFD
jgi:hypothetical protein